MEKLFVEANAQLGYLKLPKDLFGKHENLVKQTHYGMFHEQLGEDPILNHKKNLISAQNQESRGVYLQLQDGKVPSFEQFKAIKDQLEKDKGKAHTPLKQQQLQKETVEQYLKLEAMA